MNLPTSNSECIKDKTFSSSAPNSDASLSSLSRRTNDFTAARLKLALSMIGEEPPDDDKISFIDLCFFPALEKGPPRIKQKQLIKLQHIQQKEFNCEKNESFLRNMEQCGIEWVRKKVQQQEYILNSYSQLLHDRCWRNAIWAGRI